MSQYGPEGSDPRPEEPEWPSYPPAAAPEPAPPTQDLGYPPAPDQGYPATPPYGYPPAPDGYPATSGYGTSPYEVNPYQPTFGGYSPYGYGAAALPHPQSTTALVLGIVGVTFCPFAGIGALVLGNRARREIDAQPQRYSGRGPATAGWVLGIISIVVLVFWVLFVALGIAGAWDS